MTTLTPAPKAANAVTYISSALTCVKAVIVKTFVRTAVVQCNDDLEEDEDYIRLGEV